MTTDNRDDSRYDPVVIEKRRCPPAVLSISTAMITLAVCQGLFVLLNGGAPVQNERVAVVNTVLFFSAFTHLIAGISLRGLAPFARWLALINIGVDAGMILLWVYLLINESLRDRSPYTFNILLNLDLYYLLAPWLLLLIVLIVCFIVLTHPKTVKAFEAE